MIGLEIACFNLESAVVAANSLADRIEFCADYKTGGITPSLPDFTELRALTHKPIYVMIRPRDGNFVYTATEIVLMQEQITSFAQAGANGFVFGCLTSDNEIDLAANQLLIESAGGLPCTFHRAIDETTDIIKATNQVIKLRFSSILSSGKSNTAMQGTATLKAMHQQAQNKLQLVCGGGIRSVNIQAFLNELTPTFVHSAALVNNQTVASLQEINQLKKLLSI